MDYIEIIVNCQNCKKENILAIKFGNKESFKCEFCKMTILDYQPVNGYIYILSNPKMPKLVKIGYTNRDVNERIRELNSETGVPAKFILEAYFISTSPENDESKIHKKLSQYRVEEKEFFEIDLESSLRIIESICSRPPKYMSEKIKSIYNPPRKRIEKIDRRINWKKVEEWQERMFNKK